MYNDFLGKRANCSVRTLLFAIGVAMLLPVTACNKQQSPSVSAEPQAFASPEEAGKALADAAKAQNQTAIQQIFGPGSADILSTGDAVEDKASLDGFAQAHQAMHRWRKLGDGNQLLLV